MSHINVNFGSGASDLFLMYNDGEPRVLDYEYDAQEIHALCGGRQYYSSRSGMSGSGWIESYNKLIPVGYYRTDVANFDWIFSVEVAEDIEVMVPYQAHTQDKRYYEYPVVVTRFDDCFRDRNDVIVYTTLDRLAEVVKVLYLGKEDELGESSVYEKCFVDDCGYTTKVSFKFFNIWGERSFNPWHFMTRKLHNFACDEWAGVWGVFGLTKLAEDFYCRRYQFAGKCYRGERIEGLTDEIFEEGGEALAAFVPDWEIVDTAAKKSTRNGQGYRTLYWTRPEKYREWYIPKIFFETVETIDEMKKLMGFNDEENAEENGDEED